MFLVKTDKARAELQPGQRQLQQRERTLLLLADGTRTHADLRALFDGEAEAVLRRLVTDGYLDLASQRPGKRSASTNPPTASTGVGTTQARPGGTRTPAPVADAPVAEPESRSGADQFAGRRSLATTRLFLFDICERLFARRDPAAAERYRLALREARDRDTMLAVARDIVSTVESLAGAERADAISERIAAMLPDDQPA